MGLSAWLRGGGNPAETVADTDVRDSPGAPGFTPDVYAQRSYMMTGVGYTGASQVNRIGRAPMNLEPDVDYVRTPASPLLDRAWQGFQKDNALALLQYSSRHPGMGPHVPGTDPPESVYETNPMTLLVSRGSRVNKTPAGVGAVGPGMDWMPNPTNPTATYAEQPTGLWATIARRLFGG